MCGISGFTQLHHQQGDVDNLKAMGEAMLHRGPDAGGEFLNDNVGLCHRRLSIIDLSDASLQPMHSADRKVTIVFNGEIYNFQSLRDTLIDEGVIFNSEGDTEVILALYQKYGTDMLSKINGMFAFALWDHGKNSMFLARDRMGKKPLYYTFKNGDILFASEIKSLLQLPQVEKSVRLDAVYDFFAYQYVPDPKTIFENVYKLEPGHFMVVDTNGHKIEQYWDLSFSEVSNKSETELKQELQDKLKACTKRRMISDVPLGAFLSGGIDSSGIVALMSELSEKPISTCSIGFDEKKFNETEFAKSVADLFKTDHHEFCVNENVVDNLEQIVAYFDEPFADPSLVPTYFVSKLARQKVTVAVAGDGGDEVFAGYSKYSVDDIENKLRTKFPKWLRSNVFPLMAKTAGKINAKPFKKAKSLLNSLSVEPAMGFYITNSMITDEDWQNLVRPDIKGALGDYHPSNITIEKYNQADGPDHLSKILYTDMKTYLPGGILVKVDRMSMANSLEVRAPILDYELVEFAATCRSELKFNEGEKKYLLKEAFKDKLTEEILYRKKMGFSVPLAKWLREDIAQLVEQKLITKPTGLKRYFSGEQIKSYWQSHQSGQKDHSNVLWSMLMFQLWWDKYIGDCVDV